MDPKVVDPPPVSPSVSRNYDFDLDEEGKWHFPILCHPMKSISAWACGRALLSFATSASSTRLNHRWSLLLSSNWRFTAWIFLVSNRSSWWVWTSSTVPFGLRRHRYGHFNVKYRRIQQSKSKGNLKVAGLRRLPSLVTFNCPHLRQLLFLQRPSVSRILLYLALREQSVETWSWYWLKCSVALTIIRPSLVYVMEFFAMTPVRLCTSISGRFMTPSATVLLPFPRRPRVR